MPAALELIKPQIDILEYVVPAQQEEVLVSPLDRLLEVTSGFLDPGIELPSLALVEPLDRLIVIPKVFPGEQLFRFVAEGGITFGDREDQGALEGPPGLPVLADVLIEQLSSGGVSVGLLGGHDDQGQHRTIGDLAALVGERDSFQTGRPRLERLLEHLIDPLVDVSGGDARAAVGEELVPVGGHAEPVGVVFRRQLLAAIPQGFEGGLGVGEIEGGRSWPGTIVSISFDRIGLISDLVGLGRC